MKPFHFFTFSLLPLSLAFLIGCDAYQEPQKKVTAIDISDDLVDPEEYIVPYTATPLVIDGRPDDLSWTQARFSHPFIDIEGEKTPYFETRVKMLWNEQYLYVFAELEEEHVWGDLVKRDTVIFYNNDFEVFICPSGTTQPYGEFEINALGTLWDLYLNKPYRDGGSAINAWNPPGVKTAVHINGSLNDPSDTDSSWTVEMALPLRSLIELKSKPRSLPQDGEQWRINFSRVQWDHDLIDGTYQRKKDSDGKHLPEYNWVWSDQGVINMHEPEKWGTIQFSTRQNVEDVTFFEETDRHIEQSLYALYRRTKRGDLQYLLQESPGIVLSTEVQINDSTILKPEFHRTHRGFEWVLDHQDHQWILNEGGQISKR